MIGALLAAALAAPPPGVDPMAQLRAVQSTVNAAVRPRTDWDLYGHTDLWTLGAREGDCEDIAITKRAVLLALGWREADLRLVRVDVWGETAHAFLEVRWPGHSPVLLDSLFLDPIDWTVAKANGYGPGSTMKLKAPRLETVNGRRVIVVGP